MSCCYAQYVLGEKKRLSEILDFTKSKNYQIRCAVVNLMKDFINADNKECIRENIEKLIEQEEVIAVKSNAEKFLKNM